MPSKKIIHFTLDFFPVRGWSESLIMPIVREHAKNNNVFIITKGEEFEEIAFENIIVYRIPKSDSNVLQQIVSNITPDIILFHTFTPFVNHSFISFCKIRRFSTYFLLHHSSVICLTGSLIQNGTQVCNGVLIAKKCTICYAKSLGLPLSFSKIVYSFSPDFLERISRYSPSKLKTILSLYKTTKNKIEDNKLILNSLTGIITINNWCKLLFIKNGIPEIKIHKVPLGLSTGIPLSPIINTKINNEFKAIFVGQISEAKGVHLITKAIAILATRYNCKLDLYGPIEENFKSTLLKPYTNNGNVSYKGILPDNMVISTMNTYDAVLVSSITKETGPLTVLEGLAAQKPIIGTNVDGINEMIIDKVNGLLVKRDNLNDWIDKIKLLLDNRRLLEELTFNAKLPDNRRMVIMHAILNETLDL